MCIKQGLSQTCKRFGILKTVKGSNTIQRGRLVQSFRLKHRQCIQGKMAYLDKIIRYKMRNTQRQNFTTQPAMKAQRRRKGVALLFP